MLRVDVSYLRPDNYLEVGLVDYPEGAKPKTPTLFVGAYCTSRKDKQWFERMLKEIIARSKRVRRSKEKHEARAK